MLRFSPALSSALASATDKTNWCQLLIAALGSTRSVIIKQSPTQDDVWASGTTILNAVMSGTMTETGGRVTGLGVVGLASTQVSANLSSGFCLLRIYGGESNEMWLEGTFGLNGSGRDFRVRASPANSNTGYGFLSTMTIGAPANLPNSGGGSKVFATNFVLESTIASNQSNVPMTFGQTFPDGVFDPATKSLYLELDGVNIPCQFDAVASYASGKARAVVISAIAPSLPASGSRTFDIYVGDKITQGSGTFNPDLFDPFITATISGVAWTAKPRDAFLAALASNTGVRLNGPAAKEVRVAVPFKNASNADHPHLMAYLDVRMYSTNSIWVDLIIENGWLLAASPSDFTYSLLVADNANGGATIFSQASFTHYSHARWHRPFWLGNSYSRRNRPNIPYLLASKATWNYDRTTTISSSELATLQSRVNASNTGPMGPCLLQTYMPNTGGREEIAPQPTWTAMYLTSQDPRAYDAMIKNANAAATAPVHFRDQTYGLPVSTATRPSISVRYGASSPPVPSVSSATPWTPDVAHQGSLCYMPYLITGDNFYIEECTFWASWNIAGVNPSNRGGPTYNTILGDEQTRGQAWGLRSILEICMVAPDGWGLKSYFRQAMDQNVAWGNTNLGNPAGNALVTPMGGVIDIYEDQVAPWQCDFFMMVLALAKENGEAVDTWFNNVARFQVGRVSAATQAAGFCTSQAAGYWWDVKTTGGAYINTWGALYARQEFAGTPCTTTVSTGAPAYADYAGGYAAVCRGMLGSMVNAGHPDAPANWARWLTFTPLLAPDFSRDPAYNIVPRT